MNQLPTPLSTYITTTLPKMEGWCTPEKATFLANHILTTKPANALEIGVFAGRSLFAIALALQALGLGGQVLGIDPWSPVASIAGFESDPANRDWWAKLDHSDIYTKCLATSTALGLTNVHFFRGTAAQAAVALKFARPTPWLSLLHIDGNHSEASALADVDNFVPQVLEGGTVVFDDLDWTTTKLAQQRLKQLCTLNTMIGNCGVYTRLPNTAVLDVEPANPATPA